MTGPAALEVVALNMTFGATRALRSLSLEIGAGEVRAVLGENGSGKSTLIKILSGFHQPDPGGSVRVRAQPLPFGNPAASQALGLRFVHQHLGLIDALSVVDNLGLGSGFPTRFGTIRRSVAAASASRALLELGLDIDPQRRVAELTPAEATGVAIARALRGVGSGSIALLVLDEPTATLPATEVDRLMDIVRAVRAQGVAVLYVTHRLEEVFRIADAATVLRDGAVVATVPVADLTPSDLVHYLVGSELDDIRETMTELVPSAEPPLLKVRDLHGSHLYGVSFEARPGEILGVAGITGSGREEICGAVFGAGEVSAGTVTVGGRKVRPETPLAAINLGVAYVPADRARQGLMPLLSARENLSITHLSTLWRAPSLRRAAERRAVSKSFTDLDVRPAGRFEQSIGTFSGGNQQKLVFGKWLQRDPRVLLLDEPTQGVDIGTKSLLHKRFLAAAAGGAAVVVSSSDNEELAAVCHRVLIFHEGRITGLLEGSAVTPSAIARELLASRPKVGTP